MKLSRVSTWGRGTICPTIPRPRQGYDQALTQYREAGAEDLRASERRKGPVTIEDLIGNEGDVYLLARQLSSTAKARAGFPKYTPAFLCAFLPPKRIAARFFLRSSGSCAPFSFVPLLFTGVAEIGWRGCV